jgi:hypothetical protein
MTSTLPLSLVDSSYIDIAEQYKTV